MLNNNTLSINIFQLQIYLILLFKCCFSTADYIGKEYFILNRQLVYYIFLGGNNYN